MKQAVKLHQLDVKLANCRKLESGVFNALKSIPVGHVKLRVKLGQLAKTPANATVFLSPQFVMSLPHINVCGEPHWGVHRAHVSWAGSMHGINPTGSLMTNASEEIMNGETLLRHALRIVQSRRTAYGDSTRMFKEIAQRWSLTIGAEVSPAAVVLCLIDLKLARLHHNPAHLDSITDIAGYAAVLAEITQGGVHGE